MTQEFYIIDGDLPVKVIIGCIKACGYWNRPLVIRFDPQLNNKPNELKKFENIGNFEYIPVIVGKAGKESVDKYIGILCQKAIDSGLKVLNIFAQDSDFADMARYLLEINPDMGVHINVIYPKFPKQKVNFSKNMDRIWKCKSNSFQFVIMSINENCQKYFL